MAEEKKYIRETAELTAAEITFATEGVLKIARNLCGQRINAKSIDLRLWCAAALVHSTIDNSIESEIRASFEHKLSIMLSMGGD